MNNAIGYTLITLWEFNILVSYINLFHDLVNFVPSFGTLLFLD